MEIKISVLQFKETRCLKKGKGIRKGGKEKKAFHLILLLYLALP